MCLEANALFITFILHKWKLLLSSEWAQDEKKKTKRKINRYADEQMVQRWIRSVPNELNAVANECDSLCVAFGMRSRDIRHKLLSLSLSLDAHDVVDDNNKHKHNNNTKNKIFRCATHFTILIFICSLLNDHRASLTSIRRFDSIPFYFIFLFGFDRFGSKFDLPLSCPPPPQHSKYNNNKSSTRYSSHRVTQETQEDFVRRHGPTKLEKFKCQ